MNSTLRDHLLELLGKGGAHVGFDAAVADVPVELRGARVPNVPHTAWRLVEHLRIAQADILAFSIDARHRSPPWPDGYWPTTDAPPDPAAWDRSVAAFQSDRSAMIALISRSDIDLLAPLPHGHGQTLAREAMLMADHAAYHIGQLILLRRALGCWPDSPNG